MEQLSTGIVSLIGGGFLGIFLAAAGWTDIRSHRIPNKLVLAGSLIGLTLHTLLPEGSGLFGELPGGLGLLMSLAGLAAGLGALLPLYALRVMGAGDVKLMAMVGTFLGPKAVLGAVLMTFVAGGVLAVALALWNGALMRTLANIRFMVTHSMVKAVSGAGAQIEALPTSAGKLPYAVAIAAGTASHILLARSGHALFA